MSDPWSKARFEELFRAFEGEDPESSRGKKRVRVLRAAIELFTDQGYRKTSVDEIARKAAVAKGTVYNFFPSKGALLLAAVVLEKRVLLQILDPILSGTLPEAERLRFYVHTLLTMARELPLVSRLLRQDDELMVILDEVDPELTASNRQQSTQMLSMLIELAAPGLLDEAEKARRAQVLASLGFFTARILEPHVRGDLGFDEYVDALTDVVTAGLIAPPREPGA